MRSILITGCNKGIGLGLIKNICKNNELKHIIATCRNPEKAQELQEICEKHKNVHILQAEMKDNSSIENLAKSVSEIVGLDGLDTLINNAGMSSKFTRLQFVKADQLTEHFQVNTIAPIMMTKNFLPLLRLSAVRQKDQPTGSSKAVVINMSSVLASIEQNVQGGLYPYRTSKAALNAATKSMSIDLKDTKIIVVSLHPGWVKTELGGANAPMEVEDSVSCIIKFLNNITEKHNGKFYDYLGNELPW